MLFNSFEFLFAFLPITLLVFLVLRAVAAPRVSLLWLTAASLFFYGWWNPKYLLLIGLSVLVNHALGSSLGRTSSKESARHRGVLILGIAFNLGLLGYYKYAHFFVESAAAVTGLDWTVQQVILPLGISFFTFQQIGFLVDAYKTRAAVPPLLEYALFVTFFPQLIAGPIVHHREMLPQLLAPGSNLQLGRFSVGISIFVIGLAKKVLVADNLAPYASDVFAAAQAGQQLGFLAAWQGALAYSLQLYFDFSGYSEMAIGLGHLFGVRLPRNFNSPYRARGIADFWRRWHMTLSQFLRDYVYIPLGGNRRGTGRRYVNLMLTMLLGGLWHGAGWTFVVWGGLHGLYLCIEQGFVRLLPGVRKSALWQGPVGQSCSWALTFVAVVVGWVFFRAESLGAAERMMSAMFLANGLEVPGTLGRMLAPLGVQATDSLAHYEGATTMLALVGIVVALLLFPNVGQLFSHYRPTSNFQRHLEDRTPVRLRWRPKAMWAAVLAALATGAMASLFEVSEFLYFQF